MPEYTFQSGKKIQYFFFSMKDVPSIGTVVEIQGKQWTRIITEAPAAQIDSVSNSNINNSKKFAEVTAKKGGTYGDLIDLSKELSQQRAEKNDGVDEIRESFKREHARKRKGRNLLKNED